jgi:hypothetical protein
MPSTTRRLAPTALLLSLALLLAVAPAQARESPSSGWFSALTHQLMQWTAGWWGLPSGQATNRPLSPASPRPPVTVDCGIEINPNGGCLHAIVIGPGAAHSRS